MKNNFLLIGIAAVSIALFLFTNFVLYKSTQSNLASIETVKSQISNAKSAIINFPAPDYSIAILASAASLSAGIGIGFIAASYFRGEK